jgi:hypothetical protein
MGITEALMITNRLAARDAALVFARAGISIFPCVIDGKRPLTGSGFHEATRDIDQVRRWWARWPRANIGMPTGGLSGIDVVDIDVTRTDSGFAAFERATDAGLVDGELARVRTPSGGLHIYYPADESQDQRCWQAASAHIDFRGNGGYIIVPPSALVTENQRVGYHLFSLSAAGGKPIDAVALRRFIDPQSPHARSRPPVIESPEPSRLARWVGGLQEGERNRGLFWAACRLAEAGFDPSAIENALAPAAKSAGLPELETAATIRSASRLAAPRPSSSTDTWSDRNAPRRRAGEAPCLT